MCSLIWRDPIGSLETMLSTLLSELFRSGHPKVRWTNWVSMCWSLLPGATYLLDNRVWSMHSLHGKGNWEGLQLEFDAPPHQSCVHLSYQRCEWGGGGVGGMSWSDRTCMSPSLIMMSMITSAGPLQMSSRAWAPSEKKKNEWNWQKIQKYLITSLAM